MKIKSAHFKKEFDLHKAELIGQGNFAQVYRIFDNQLKDSIAIRKVKKSLADLDDIDKEKHINEELRKVDNQNILKIYDIIDQPETVWYITEYCSGGSLWDALNLCKDNKMGEKQALECILQVSKGVQELHNHRITHRDLKPQNILLKSKYLVGKSLPQIKLADFGLSTQKIIMETIAGTKEYIAPEQAKFHNYTNAVDVWSLGIIFDEVLHGTPFYSGEDNKEVFNKILKMPFKIRDENIRPSIKQLLLSLLKKKPYERPIIAVIRSTVEKILEEIEAEKNNKLQQSHSEKNKKSKSSNQTGGDFSKNSSQAKIESVNSSSKENGIIHSRKVYESGTVEREEEKLDKTWKSTLGQDLTPQSRQKVNNIKEGLDYFAKNQPSGQPKAEIKQEIKDRIVSGNYREKVNKNKSIIDQILPQKKEEKKSNQNSASKLPKQEQKVSAIPPIHEKINIYKSDRKKVASNIKKEEYKNQVVDLGTYKQKIFNEKKGLMDKQIRMDKVLAFLPNSQLSPNQYSQIRQSTDDAISSFKKKLNFINYFAENEDYEVRLGKGLLQLQTYKAESEGQMAGIKQNIKKIFLEQLDNYIDQYIDKIIR